MARGGPQEWTPGQRAQAVFAFGRDVKTNRK